MTVFSSKTSTWNRKLNEKWKFLFALKCTEKQTSCLLWKLVAIFRESIDQFTVSEDEHQRDWIEWSTAPAVYKFLAKSSSMISKSTVS
jgi:hypothetical protein